MLWTFYTGGGLPQQEDRVCPKCGMRESEVTKTGKVGCAQCYKTFQDILEPYVHRIHGNTIHTGRRPSRNRKLDELRLALKKAVETQEFERAAQLRDQIKELEQHEHQEH